MTTSEWANIGPDKMPILRLGRAVLGVSRVLLVRGLRLARINKKPIRNTTVLSLPVAGIDEPNIQSVFYALSQAVQQREDAQVPELWLTTVQLTQIASDRLLQDLSIIDEHLNHWQNAMAHGAHYWMMFLRNGPVVFYNKMKALVEGETEDVVSATEMIEQRVLILRNLQRLVSRALGEVQAIADRLCLSQNQEDNDNSNQASGDTSEQGNQLIASAHAAIVKTCTALVNVIKTLKDDAAGFADFENAKKHLKELAVKDARAGSFDHPRSTGVLQGPGNFGANRSADISALKASIIEVENMMGAVLNRNPQRSVNSALQETTAVVADMQQIAAAPLWTRSPSKYQKNWLEYGVAGLIGLWSFWWLLKHSPLMGSPAIFNLAKSIKNAFSRNIMGPIRALREKLFQTFRNTPSIVSRDEYEVSEESLVRMLKEFASDNERAVKRLPPVSGKVTATEDIKGMVTLMRVYEHELKHPIWNVITGGLARALLIQVQKMKTDVEAAMLQLDSILSANELNVAMIAAIPSVLIAGGLLYIVVRSLQNTGPDPFVSATPCRLNLVELQRVLSKCQNAPMTPEFEGMLMHRLHRVHKSCWKVFQSRDKRSSESEWPSMWRDMIDLASRKLDIEQKLRVCQRMQITYKVFQIPK